MKMFHGGFILVILNLVLSYKSFAVVDITVINHYVVTENQIIIKENK